MSAVKTWQHFIDGGWVAPATGASFPVLDPSTEEVIARAAEGSAADVDLAVAAARRAFDEGPWRTSTAQERGRVLFRLAEKVRANVTIDWTVRETARAQLKVLVKRILRVHKYPPDKQEKATETVLEQAEALSEIWAVA